jgi:hypothetical protein
MGLRNSVRRYGAAAALCGALAVGAAGASAGGWKAEATYELADVDLSTFLGRHVPALVGVDDHGVDLGGIGSDLWHGPGDGPGVYWMLTDRGPNGEDPRTFPVPEFTPFVLKVRTRGGAIEILDAIPLVGPGGASDGVTGLPNLDGVAPPPAPNEPFFACDGVTPLATNPNGIDPEGLVRARDGTFWVAEEYSPSLLHVDADGRVLERWFPDGLLSYLGAGPDYPSDDATAGIPAIFGLKRKLNRGFEGLTLSPNGKTLYVALQSPLRNPDNATGDAARVTRILAFDVTTERVTAEYVYRFEFTGPGTSDDDFDVPSLGTTGRARPRDMKVSALAMVDEHRMLVLERTDFKAKVFLVDLRHATNILGTVWDDVSTAPSLETLVADGALEANGVTPLPKDFVVTFDSTAGWPQKIEGMTVLDGKTIAIANDNDFGVGSFAGPDCELVGTGLKSRIVVVRLDEPLRK